jgi:hypothetical protein
VRILFRYLIAVVMPVRYIQENHAVYREPPIDYSQYLLCLSVLRVLYLITRNLSYHEYGNTSRTISSRPHRPSQLIPRQRRACDIEANP